MAPLHYIKGFLTAAHGKQDSTENLQDIYGFFFLVYRSVPTVTKYLKRLFSVVKKVAMDHIWNTDFIGESSLTCEYMIDVASGEVAFD